MWKALTFKVKEGRRKTVPSVVGISSQYRRWALSAACSPETPPDLQMFPLALAWRSSLRFSGTQKLWFYSGRDRGKGRGQHTERWLHRSRPFLVSQILRCTLPFSFEFSCNTLFSWCQHIQPFYEAMKTALNWLHIWNSARPWYILPLVVILDVPWRSCVGEWNPSRSELCFFFPPLWGLRL